MVSETSSRALIVWPFVVYCFFRLVMESKAFDILKSLFCSGMRFNGENYGRAWRFLVQYIEKGVFG